MKDNYLSVNKISVLIADDEDRVRAVIKDYLNHTDKKFVIAGEASNGNETVKKYKAIRPDLVIMKMMPKSYSLNTLKNILTINPKARVVMLTTLSQMEEIRKCKRAGAKGFILIPFDNKTLIAGIKKALKA